VNLESFLQALRDDPDDLTQRLVFADWLEDNGDADRAELIRLQCSAIPRPFWEDEGTAGTPRERELIEIIARRGPGDWIDDVGRLGRGLGVVFRRGMLHVRFFTSYAEKLPLVLSLLRSGWVERLRIETPEDCDPNEFPPVNELAGLTWLSFWEQGFPFGLKEYLARLPQLRRLELSGVPYGDEIPKMLAALPHLYHLRWVDSWLTADQVRELMPVFSRCRTIDLDECAFGDDGLSRVLDGVAPGRLTGLRLYDAGIGPESAARLAACDKLSNLTALNLSANALTDEGVRALASSPHLRKLTSLTLDYVNVTESGVRALASSSLLDGLINLDLSSNNLRSDAARLLAASPRLSRLRRLDVGNCSIGEAGARELVLSDRLAGLVEINLTGNAIPLSQPTDQLTLEQWRELFGMPLTDDPTPEQARDLCRLLVDGSPPLRRRAAEILARLWKARSEVLPPEADGALVRAMADTELLVQTRANDALASRPPGPSALPRLLDLLRSMHGGIIGRALHFIGQLGEQATGVEDVILDLTDGRPEVSVLDLAQTLANVHAASPRAVEAFRSWLLSSSSVLALPAAQGLAQQRLDLPDVIAAWLRIAALNQVSEAFRVALGRWPDAVERVLAYVDEVQPQVRASVAHVLRLAQEPGDAILRTLARLLLDENESVQTSAGRAVVSGNWRSSDFIDPLLIMLDDPRHERLAVQALRVQGDLAAPAVPDLLRVGMMRRRHDAFLLCRDLGPLTQPHAEAFRDALRRTEPKQAELAQMALRQCAAHWPDASAILRAWLDDPCPAVRAAAERSLSNNG
jgi:uncharacterized protein (TIGR02996 family)